MNAGRAATTARAQATIGELIFAARLELANADPEGGSIAAALDLLDYTLVTYPGAVLVAARGLAADRARSEAAK